MLLTIPAHKAIGIRVRYALWSSHETRLEQFARSQPAALSSRPLRRSQRHRLRLTRLATPALHTNCQKQFVSYISHSLKRQILSNKKIYLI